MCASLGVGMHEKDESRSKSTASGGRFATIRGVRPTHESSVDSSDLDTRHRLLVALISAKDPGGSYSMMSRVLEASRLWSTAHIRESGHITAVILKMRVLFAVQVSVLHVHIVVI